MPKLPVKSAEKKPVVKLQAPAKTKVSSKKKEEKDTVVKEKDATTKVLKADELMGG
ncbi:MAG: hypothetical protein WCL02_04640 [bacterium]